MAQKSFPRSMRSDQLLSANYSFYAEDSYANLWQKSSQLLNHVLQYSQQNLHYRNKRQSHRPLGKRKKLWCASFLNSAFSLSQGGGSFKITPILFKLAENSLSYKYNPLKKVSPKKKAFSLRSHKGPLSGERFKPTLASTKKSFF